MNADTPLEAADDRPEVDASELSAVAELDDAMGARIS
jgi:hypothetical protein